MPLRFDGRTVACTSPRGHVNEVMTFCTQKGQYLLVTFITLCIVSCKSHYRWWSGLRSPNDELRPCFTPGWFWTSGCVWGKGKQKRTQMAKILCWAARTRAWKINTEESRAFFLAARATAAASSRVIPIAMVHERHQHRGGWAAPGATE